MSKRKIAAMVGAVVLSVVGVTALSASAGPAYAPDVYVSFGVFPTGHGYVARAVIAQAPAVPPSTSTPYTRVFQARAASRALAIEGLIRRMSDELSARQVVELLGLKISEQDL